MATGSDGGEKDGLQRIVVLIAVLLGLSTAGSFIGRGSSAPSAVAVPGTSDPSEKATAEPLALADDGVLRPLNLFTQFMGPAELSSSSGSRPAAIAQRLKPLVSRLENEMGLLPHHAASSEVVVATVPDWVDSSLQWNFDSIVDALQLSAARLDYVLTAFDLPDTPGSDGYKESAEPSAHRIHESIPGALLFRRITPPAAGSGDAPRVEMLLILLVPETTTQGVHAQAFANALDLALVWNSETRSQRAPEHLVRPARGASTIETAGRHRRPDGVAILGPNYSGSAASVRYGLEAAARRHELDRTGRSVWFQLLSPSATNSRNPDMLRIAGLAEFGSVMRSDDETLRVLSDYLGTIRRDWRCGAGVALLVESNTAWGRGFSQKSEECEACQEHPESSNKGLLSCATYVPFPLHISRLRKEAQQSAGQPPAKIPSGYNTRLDLDERSTSTDRISPATPALTDALSESMVAGMFRSLQDPGITAIGILATDKRDHVFLAQELATHRPGVQQFTIESSLVYLHPDSRSYVRGTLIASTYSLNTRTQFMTREPRARLFTQQFASSSAHGVFNALAALMGEPGQMLDYDSPTGPGDRVSDKSPDTPCHERLSGSTPCSPPVWISVAAQGTLLPITARGGDSCGMSDAGYASCAPGTRGPPAWSDQKNLSGRVLPLPPLTWLGCFLIVVALVVDQRFRALKRKKQTAAPESSEVELRVSALAMQAATLTIALWVLKLAGIWAADRFGWVSLPVMRGILLVLCAGAFVWIVGRMVGLLWRGGKDVRIRSWAGRILAILCLASGAAWLVLDALHVPHLPSLFVLFAIVLGFAAISVCCDLKLRRLSEIGDRVPQWRRVPVLLGVLAFLYLAASLAADSWQPADAILYFDRSSLPSTLISPGVPIILFACALYWWGCWNMRRVHLLRFPETEIGIGELLDTRARRAGFDPDRMLREPSLSMGISILIPILALVVTCFGFRTGASIEGARFGVFLFLASACIHTTMSHTLAHTLSLGTAVRKLLASLARHPAIEVMKTLAKEPFDWRMTYAEPRRPAFEPLARHIERVEGLIQHWSSDDLQRLIETQDPQLAQRARERLATMAGEVATRLRFDPKLPAPRVKLNGRDWRELNALVNAFHEILARTRWSSSFSPEGLSPVAASALEEMERIVFFHAAVVLRDLLSRLVSGFTAALGGLLLVLLGHLLYTFQGRVFWLILDATAISFAAGTAIFVLQGLERNDVLSVLWQSAPGRISLSGKLTWRMGIYALIVAATLLATVFPELGGALFKWIEPTRKLFAL